MRFYLTLLSAALLPLLTLAQVQQATIVTRPGVATPPIKYYFDLSSALSEGVNQGVKVTVSASNAEKTAVRFDSVKLFDQSGATVGNNVASKTDALTANPYGFTFSNFGVAPADLASVAGVEITFMDLGGENPTGKVTVQSVAVSVTRDNGEACVIADPITVVLPPPPPPTIVSIQRARPLVQPGTHGTGDSGGGGGGGSTNLGPYYGSNAANNGGGAVMWTNASNVFADDSANATASTGSAAQTANLDVTGFGFGSIPTNSIINGVVLEIDRGVSPGASAQDTTVYLISGGSTVSNNVASGDTWTAAGGVATYGSATNASTFWGGGVNAPIVVGATFGVRISVLISAPTQAHIDYMRMTVYYTPVGGSVYDSFMDLIWSLLGKIRR